MIVGLDAEAFNALMGADSMRKLGVRRILRVAQRLGEMPQHELIADADQTILPDHAEDQLNPPTRNQDQG